MSRLKLKAYELLVYLMIKNEEEQKEWIKKFEELKEYELLKEVMNNEV